MDTIFINSENSIKLTNKLDLRISEKIIVFSNLSIYYTWKNIKNSYNDNKFKISAPAWTINLNHQVDRILYQIFKIAVSIFYKNMEKINHEYKYM